MKISIHYFELLSFSKWPWIDTCDIKRVVCIIKLKFIKTFHLNDALRICVERPWYIFVDQLIAFLYIYCSVWTKNKTIAKKDQGRRISLPLPSLYLNLCVKLKLNYTIYHIKIIYLNFIHLQFFLVVLFFTSRLASKLSDDNLNKTTLIYLGLHLAASLLVVKCLFRLSFFFLMQVLGKWFLVILCKFLQE